MQTRSIKRKQVEELCICGKDNEGEHDPELLFHFNAITWF